jgi:hypothetical protein
MRPNLCRMFKIEAFQFMCCGTKCCVVRHKIHVSCKHTLEVLRGQRPLVPLLLIGPPFFPNYSFWVHHPVNRDDWHLLANAMASDFSVTWQCLSERTIDFSLRIKLHAKTLKGL